MTSARISRVWGTILLTITIFSLSLPAYAQYSGGTGEPNDPYQIATAEDLMLLGESPEDYDKHFIMTADIDLDPNLPGCKVFDRAIIAPDMNDATEWFDGIAFTGAFDGNAHTISHLTIAGGSYLGLFGVSNTGARISNLGLIAVDVTGTGDFVGGLIGSDYGSIITCSSSGLVSGSGYVGGLVGYGGGNVDSSHSGTSVSGTNQVGGLVGSNAGSIYTSYSSGLVSGVNDVGGLAGVNGGTMTSSYSMSSVTGESYVGGLVGANGGYGPRGGCFMGSIYDCYATGAVVGIDYVAGLLGYNMGDVIRCHSTGAVTGATTNISGLVLPGGECGGYDGPSYRVDYVDACFWDIETSGQTVSSGGGIGKTTAEMQNPNTYMAAGWDFIGQSDGPHDIWVEPEGGGYPILWWSLPPLVNLPQFSGGTGEPDTPYLISTPEELNCIGHNPRLMSCHFKLINDIDLIDCYLCTIGDSVYPYTGVFDGDGYTISNLTIRGGLFGWVAGCESEIRNCRLVDPNVEWAGGALVDCLENGSIINCHIRGANIYGGSVGGLVGYCQEGRIINCIVEDCTISGYSTVGGLVGSHQRGIISDCLVHGVHISADSTVGGLAGEGYGTIIRCSVWDTEVLAGNPLLGRVGGLVAYGGATAARIQDCQVNGGVVRGTWEAGGLVGWMTRGIIAGCHTSTRVEASAGDGKSAMGLLVGGLAGSNGGTIQDCYSASSVSQGSVTPGMDWLFTSGAGGLAGYNSGTIDRSYSTGSVTGTLYVGGLVGKNAESKGSVTGCFWDTETSGQLSSAGGEGKTTNEMQDIHTYQDVGWDFVDETENGTEDIWWILEGQDYPRLWWEPISENSSMSILSASQVWFVGRLR
jgi:hypothetical protein